MVWLGVTPKKSGKLWSGVQLITQNDDEMNFHDLTVGGGTKLYPLCSQCCLGDKQKKMISLFHNYLGGGSLVMELMTYRSFWLVNDW